MKISSIAATAALVPSTAYAWNFIDLFNRLGSHEKVQQPTCSLYDGFKNSPSFTSFCKQLPRATNAAVGNAYAPASSSPYTPSISTELFTFDGGATTTVSPNADITSNTYVMPNYTITTSGSESTSSQSSMDMEKNCYINGSKLSPEECSRTASLTHEHGSTYTPSTMVTSSSASTASSGPASPPYPDGRPSWPYGRPPWATGRPPWATGRPPWWQGPRPTGGRPGGGRPGPPRPSQGMPSSSTNMTSSTSCSNTDGLTHEHGYTYTRTSSMPLGTAPLGTGSTFSKVYGTGSSYNCDNITGIAPYKTFPAGGTPIPTSVDNATSIFSSAVSSSAPPNSEAVSPSAAGAGGNIRPVVRVMTRTSTTSTLDATVTSFAPCATYNPEPHNTQTQQTRQKRTPQFGYPDAVPTPQQKQKRNIPSHLNPPAQKNVMNPKHESDFFTPNEPRAVGGMCDAGVYCVNSTFVSDAPPSWGWGAVELAEGQTCLGDELFNVEWVEEQCECAGM